MALFDSLADLTRTTNRIEPASPMGPKPAAAAAGDLQIASPAAPAAASPPARKGTADPKAPAYANEPEAIARTYFVEEGRRGERKYYDDYKRTNLAITADDARIASKREDLNTIRAMLTMAGSRGWNEVKVSGTAEFRREAWIEAQTRGIAAQGHKPSDLDRQEADRRRAERGLPPAPLPGQNEVTQAAPAPAATAPAPAPVVPAPAAAAPAAAPAPTAQQPAKAAPAVKPEQAPAPAVPVAAVATVPQQAAAQPKAQQPDPAAPAQAPDHRKALREATAELSADGRLFLTAMSAKIDKEMDRLTAAAKLELKADTATALVKKEREEGPVVLPAELKQKATAPAKQPAAEQPDRVRLVQPEPQKRSRAR